MQLIIGLIMNGFLQEEEKKMQKFVNLETAIQGEEQRIIEARSAAVVAALAEFRDQPWETRARAAAAQLTAIHDDWWTSA